MRRYEVVEGSQLGHGCCFTATVVDTQNPTMIRGEPFVIDGVQQYEVVCECLRVEDAERICDALNDP